MALALASVDTTMTEYIVNVRSVTTAALNAFREMAPINALPAHPSTE